MKQAERAVTVAEFEDRLAALCAKGRSDFPRRLRDRHILFRSIVQTLDMDRTYSESTLNFALQQWLLDVGSCVDMDHVTLRRYLVDEGFLRRAPTGTAYQVAISGNGNIQFDARVSDINASGVVQAAREHAAARKRAR